jgi:hypothetical protein
MVERRTLLAVLGASLASGAAFGDLTLAAGSVQAGASFSDPAVAGLAHYRFAPGRADELIQAWESGLLAAARRAPGFVEGLLLVDPGAGHGIGMGIFASKAEADLFGTTEAFRQANARLDSLLSEPAIREEYEVHAG